MNRVIRRCTIAMSAALFAGTALVLPAQGGDLPHEPPAQAGAKDKGKPSAQRAGAGKDKAAAAQSPNAQDKSANAADKSVNAADKSANAADKSANAADKGKNAADKAKENRDGEPADKAKDDARSRGAADQVKRKAARATRQKAEKRALAAKLKDKLKGQPAPAALMQELKRHARRVARLMRIKPVAAEQTDDDSVSRANKLLAKENNRHEKWLAKYDPKGGAP